MAWAASGHGDSTDTRDRAPTRDRSLGGCWPRAPRPRCRERLSGTCTGPTTQSGTRSPIGRSLINGTQANQRFIIKAQGPRPKAQGPRPKAQGPRSRRPGDQGDPSVLVQPGVDNGSPGTTIGRARRDGIDVNLYFIAGLNSPHRLAIRGGDTYWASRLGNTIGRARLNDTDVNQSFITGALSPVGVVAGK